MNFRQQRTSFELSDSKGIGHFIRNNPSTLQTIITSMNKSEFRIKNKISRETLQRRIDYLLLWRVIVSIDGKYRLN